MLFLGTKIKPIKQIDNIQKLQTYIAVQWCINKAA